MYSSDVTIRAEPTRASSMAAVSADRQFMEEKQRVLCEKIDLSRKGAIDAPVADLVHCLNTADHYYTTSSCSGRILVYADHEVTSYLVVFMCIVVHVYRRNPRSGRKDVSGC